MADEFLGAGIDIIEIERIIKAMNRYGYRFLRKIFTRREIEYCLSKAKPAQHFAARFAAKEAVYKAAGGEGNLWFSQIEILKVERGRPAVHLIGVKNLHGDDFIVSISHSHKYASAFALRKSKG